VRDRLRADGDEDPAHHQRQRDPDQQHLLLVLPGHGELAHDDDEDEQVVDRQRVLRQPAGEELPAGLTAGGERQSDAEQQRDADVEGHPQGRLSQGRFVRLPGHDQEVQHQQGQQGGDGDDPRRQRNVHEFSSTVLEHTRRAGPGTPPPAAGRAVAGGV
jgi:hypothetical protein